MNIEDKELVKLFNPTLKKREIILFFLIVLINELIWIILDIGLDTCARRRWRVGYQIWKWISLLDPPTWQYIPNKWRAINPISLLDPPTWQYIPNKWRAINPISLLDPLILKKKKAFWILLLDSTFKINEELLTHLMDYLFGHFHSSKTPYLTINCITPAHQINI